MHCHGGRDRTGVLTAIALSVAGAAHEAIVADYTLTEGTQARTMQDLLDHFEKQGGAAAYLTNAGVAPRHLAAVRDLLDRIGADAEACGDDAGGHAVANRVDDAPFGGRQDIRVPWTPTTSPFTVHAAKRSEQRGELPSPLAALDLRRI